MNPTQLMGALTGLVGAQLPTMVWGPPGVGKSDLVRRVATGLGRECLDVRLLTLDPVDLRGLPEVDAEEVTRWRRPWFLPRDGAGILFLDELSACAPTMAAACYQLVLDRTIGEHRLGDGWSIVAAGNRGTDRAVCHRMPSPLVSRMVHIDLEPSLDAWTSWAMSGARADTGPVARVAAPPLPRDTGVRAEVIGFLRHRPDLLCAAIPTDLVDGRPSPWACPRTWAMASRVLDIGLQNGLEREVLAGTVGAGAAAELAGFLQIFRRMVPLASIIAAPSRAPVPEETEPALTYAICAGLAHLADEDTLGPILRYSDRLPMEYRAMLARDCIARRPELASTGAWTAWAIAHASEVI